MRRRFEKKIYIPLPSKQARARLFQLCVGSSRVTLQRGDFDKLSDQTEGYSGADISIVTREAMMASVRKVISATHFKSDANQWTPCSPGDANAQAMTWDDVNGDDLIQPPTGLREFERAVQSIKCTVSADDVVKYAAWTDEFGSNAD